MEARNLPDQLADQLVIMIATGELKPGQRIFEKKICEMKGVSRIPVREALRLLQAQGVVRTEPNRGTYVTEYTSDEMLEMLEMRLAVERIALRRIIERKTPEGADREPAVGGDRGHAPRRRGGRPSGIVSGGPLVPRLHHRARGESRARADLAAAIPRRDGFPDERARGNPGSAVAWIADHEELLAMLESDSSARRWMSTSSTTFSPGVRARRPARVGVSPREPARRPSDFSYSRRGLYRSTDCRRLP